MPIKRHFNPLKLLHNSSWSVPRIECRSQLVGVQPIMWTGIPGPLFPVRYGKSLHKTLKDDARYWSFRKQAEQARQLWFVTLGKVLDVPVVTVFRSSKVAKSKVAPGRHPPIINSYRPVALLPCTAICPFAPLCLLATCQDTDLSISLWFSYNYWLVSNFSRATTAEIWVEMIRDYGKVDYF
jgi:hypothetical protein